MAIGMDTAQGKPGDALEYTAGAGGGAYIIGPAEESLATINARLAEGSDEEDVPTSQLGLFVVGRLARRYGCRVTLRTNPTGGNTAWLLLPPSMIADPTETPSTGTAASAVGLRPERARGLASTPPATPAMAPVHAADARSTNRTSAASTRSSRPAAPWISAIAPRNPGSRS